MTPQTLTPEEGEAVFTKAALSVLEEVGMATEVYSINATIVRAMAKGTVSLLIELENIRLQNQINGAWR